LFFGKKGEKIGIWGELTGAFAEPPFKSNISDAGRRCLGVRREYFEGILKKQPQKVLSLLFVCLFRPLLDKKFF
jgi:hypothetical protein